MSIQEGALRNTGSLLDMPTSSLSAQKIDKDIIAEHFKPSLHNKLLCGSMTA
jgi:hypothetical protein